MLERPPEPLDEDVVVQPVAAVHREAHAGSEHMAGEPLAGELGALVGVEDLRCPPVQRVVECLNAERDFHRVREPPREQVSRGPVHHGHEVEKALCQRDMGDVRTTESTCRDVSNRCGERPWRRESAGGEKTVWAAGSRPSRRGRHTRDPAAAAGSAAGSGNSMLETYGQTGQPALRPAGAAGPDGQGGRCDAGR